MKFFNSNIKLGFFNISSALIAFILPTIILITLPGPLIDSFILVGFIFSALLLIITLENADPLRITFLPTIVLLLTTFRLLLSIATTRNIIANEDVGEVITAVGFLVMGGNLISGLLIFIIITIVQFMVITKGGERVAEVGARFSLDALPGRQMTIDGDLKSNIITAEQAQQMRDNLTIENKLFGSLDGAMKFIKGDSIAGILISLVNLFGGIYVGINQFQLSLSESVHKFSVLTIGDGLVSQIPSLLLSLACGVYLTRIKGNADKSSGGFVDQLFSQVGLFWKSLVMISILILALGFLNTTLFFVTIPLFLIGLIVSYKLQKKQKTTESDIQDEEGTGVYESLRIVLKNSDHKFIVDDMRKNIEAKLWKQDLGVPFVEIKGSIEDDIVVYMSDVKVFNFSQNKSNDLNFITVLSDDFFILHEDLIQNLKNIIFYFIFNQVNYKYNLQFTDDILRGLGEKSEVIKNEVDSAIGINRVHDVIKQMLRSPEFFLDRITFFESMIYWSRIENESSLWFVKMRSQAKYDITSRIVNEEGKVDIILLGPELLEFIESAIESQNNTTDDYINIRTHVRSELERITLDNKRKPVVVVNSQEINFVSEFFKTVAFTISVCSQDDLIDQDIINHSEIINLP